MREVSSAFQGEVSFGYFDQKGGHSIEMGSQAVGLYPGKYGTETPAGDDPIEANIFANALVQYVASVHTKTLGQHVGSMDPLGIVGAY